MSSYDPLPPVPPRPPAREWLKTYWTMSGEGHTAEALLFKHPLGFEFEVRSDGEMQRTQVYRVSGAAERDALATMERLEARGWTLVDSTDTTEQA